jgi:DNA invertase Pin-like site-specific DNA recombinase
VNAGLQRAVAKGKTVGRPRIDRAIESKARRMLKNGVGMLRIAAELDVGWPLSCSFSTLLSRFGHDEISGGNRHIGRSGTT